MTVVSTCIILACVVYPIFDFNLPKNQCAHFVQEVCILLYWVQHKISAENDHTDYAGQFWLTFCTLSKTAEHAAETGT